MAIIARMSSARIASFCTGAHACLRLIPARTVAMWLAGRRAERLTKAVLRGPGARGGAGGRTQRGLGNINPRDRPSLLCQPDCIVATGATQFKRGSDWSRLGKLLQNGGETDESFGRNVVPKNLATGLMMYRSLWSLPVAIG